MDIFGGITAVTEGLKLVNELRKIDKEVDKADLKIRLVELVDMLWGAKQALEDAQERETSLRNEIAELKEKATRRAALRDSDGRLYEIGAAGENIGEPFCNLCFVKEDKLFRMQNHGATVSKKAHYCCDNCKTVSFTGPSLSSQPPMVSTRSSWMK